MRKKMKIRSLIIGCIFTLLFSGVVVRLYWVQVINASELLVKAERIWSQDKVLPATRGIIYDRNEHILAQDGAAYTVVVQPKIINDRGEQNKIVEALAPILQMTDSKSKAELHSLITKKKENGQFFSQVEVRSEGWKIDSETADQIRSVVDEQSLKGIFLYEDKKRYYPAQELASHVLGYSTKEGEATMGLELFYDESLRGEDGLVRYDKDGKSIELPDSKVTYDPAVNGMSLKLTIDENIQMYIEQALAASYEEFSPESITAIAVDPNTMEVLGMANYPNYNPNTYWDFASDFGNFYNHAIASTYEPGSTFKIVTLAATVEENVFNPTEKYTSGRIKVADSYIRDHNNGKGWGEISYLEGLKRSSNVAFVNLGYKKLGAVKLREYIDAFGFGQKTGIDLAGEVNGEISFRNNIPTEVATATFGQGRVAVTALQQIAAISAIANGGKLMKPYLVKEIINPDTQEIVQSFEPEVVRRVISEQSAKEVGGYLEQVVSDREIGTGRKAYIEGYRIAGKTGTAQKVINGEYSDDEWIVSFIGYAPVEDPKIAVIVIADAPDIDGVQTTGSDVGSPVFREIMLKSLRYFKVASSPKEGTVSISAVTNQVVPDLVGLTTIAAKNEILKDEFEPVVIGNGDKVEAQFPSSLSEMAKGQRIYILTQKAEFISTPDFTGMSLRDALQFCGILNMSCVVSGEGYVTQQEETEVNGQRKVSLILQPISQTIEEQEHKEIETEED